MYKSAPTACASFMTGGKVPESELSGSMRWVAFLFIGGFVQLFGESDRSFGESRGTRGWFDYTEGRGWFSRGCLVFFLFEEIEMSDKWVAYISDAISDYGIFVVLRSEMVACQSKRINFRTALQWVFNTQRCTCLIAYFEFSKLFAVLSPSSRITIWK